MPVAARLLMCLFSSPERDRAPPNQHYCTTLFQASHSNFAGIRRLSGGAHQTLISAITADDESFVILDRIRLLMEN
jgi:hypothetical protein